jgi:RNA polymerase sigma factor (sigma-70 family)
MHGRSHGYSEAPRLAEGRESSLSEEQALVVRISAGDSEAIRELFHERCGQSLSFLAQRLHCEDLFNELLIYLAHDSWRRLKTWNGDSSIGHWLEVVALRFFLRHLKERHCVKPLGPEEVAAMDESEPWEEVARNETRLALLNAVDELPDWRERLAVLLHYFEGMPLKEVAKNLQIPIANLYVIKFRAIKNLRSILDGRELR